MAGPLARIKERRRGAASAVLGLALFLLPALVSCGLEDYVYLYPPETAKTNEVLAFSNNIQNDPLVFYGYKILYRFYKSADAASDGIASVANLYTSYPTTVYDKMKSVLKYRDLLLGESKAADLIIDSADKQAVFTIQLDFTETVSLGNDALLAISEGSPVTVPDLSSSVVLYRSVSTPGNVGFEKNELLGYDDMVVDENYIDGSGETYLLLYVLAYGYNSSFIPVFSEPKYFVGSVNYILLDLP